MSIDSHESGGQAVGRPRSRRRLEPIGSIVADIVGQMRYPLPELELKRAYDDINPVASTWTEYDAEHLPDARVIDEARRIADDELLLRIVNRLAWERSLRRYGRGNRFLTLVQFFVGSMRKKGAA